VTGPGERGEYAMLEIEMKFPAADFSDVQARLEEWAAPHDAPISEEDHYFNAPDRDFARTDEALRLRRIGTANRITYKGPRQPGTAKTRTEIELPLAEGDAAADQFCLLLTHLGYRAVAVVRKERTAYHMKRDGFDIEVCLDQVRELGSFVEVEIIAPEDELSQAQQALTEVVRELGLGKSEHRSYLELLLSKMR
jgi:adenylate cyclase class 2